MQYSCSGNVHENFGEWFTHDKQIKPDTILVVARNRGKDLENTRERRLAEEELAEDATDEKKAGRSRLRRTIASLALSQNR